MKLYEKVLLGTAGAAGAGTVAWRTMFPWIGYDLQLINMGMKLTKERDEAMSSLIIDKFEKHVETQPKKPFIIFEDSVYTYEFVDQMACKVANVIKTWGLKPKDTVAMMISNEPSFVWTFFALQKLGIAAALINFNLKMGPLEHSIKAAKAKYLIVGEGQSLLENVIEIKDSLSGMQIYVQGLGTDLPPHGVTSFDPLLWAAHASGIDPVVRRSVGIDDTCCFIYTSGTTGYPKPVFITHGKSLGISCGMSTVGLTSDDLVYIPLPLYHTSGGLGFYAVIRKGATFVLKRKFSASQFWPDCAKHGVTVVQYIGELFRYLLAQPPAQSDHQHKVRAAFGNGLRKDIWEEVAKRFRIPLIAEFYGATEGTTLLLNIYNKPGAIGRLSPFLGAIDPDTKALVKFDYGTALPIRDSKGRCTKVKVGEPGLLISKVPEQLIKNGTFAPYMSSKESNEKKIVRGAFKEGDLFFNYGDVLVQDKEYFLYFKDRIGDTFRWKGENVSTTELANVITSLSFVEDANVYGVTVPGHDGRAGMVALTLNEGCKVGPKELKELYDHVRETLPDYAQPLFVRILDQAIITGTFKQQKVQLVKEAYDMSRVKDSLYFRDLSKKTYSTLTAQDLTKFISSKL